MILEMKILKFRQSISLFCNYRYFVIISSWKRVWFFIWTNLNFLHPNGRIMLSLIEFFLFRQCIFAILSLLENERDPSFEQTWIPFTQECFVPSLFEVNQVLLEKKIFKKTSVHFHYVVIISNWKRAGHFIWTNLNSLYRRILYKFDWNLPSSSIEEDEKWSLQTDGRTHEQTTDNRRSEKLTRAFSSDEVINWWPPHEKFVPATIWLL